MDSFGNPAWTPHIRRRRSSSGLFGGRVHTPSGKIKQPNQVPKPKPATNVTVAQIGIVGLTDMDTWVLYRYFLRKVSVGSIVNLPGWKAWVASLSGAVLFNCILEQELIDSVANRTPQQRGAKPRP